MNYEEFIEYSQVKRYSVGDKVVTFARIGENAEPEFDMTKKPRVVTDVKKIEKTGAYCYQLDGGKYWCGKSLMRVQNG